MKPKNKANTPITHINHVTNITPIKLIKPTPNHKPEYWFICYAEDAYNVFEHLDIPDHESQIFRIADLNTQQYNRVLFQDCTASEIKEFIRSGIKITGLTLEDDNITTTMGGLGDYYNQRFSKFLVIKHFQDKGYKCLDMEGKVYYQSIENTVAEAKRNHLINAYPYVNRDRLLGKNWVIPSTQDFNNEFNPLVSFKFLMDPEVEDPSTIPFNTPEHEVLKRFADKVNLMNLGYLDMDYTHYTLRRYISDEKTVKLPPVRYIDKLILPQAKKLVIPDTVRMLGRWAFRDCEALKEVILPTSLEVLDPYELFKRNHYLKRVIHGSKGDPKTP